MIWNVKCGSVNIGGECNSLFLLISMSQVLSSLLAAVNDLYFINNVRAEPDCRKLFAMLFNIRKDDFLNQLVKSLSSAFWNF